MSDIENDIDPEVLKRAKRDFGESCEVERKTEWSYTFKCGPKSHCQISRFLVEENFGVSASEIRQRWPSMNARERMDFAANFHFKEKWTENDTEILEIIMRDGDDHIWSSCALAMLRHPDRNRVAEFLIGRVRGNTSERPPLNYMQALAMAGEKRAVPVIRPYYVKYLKAMEAERAMGVPDNVFFGPIPYFQFLSIAGDLLKIDGSDEYEQAIRRYLDHPKEQVRYWAEYSLGVEGPATAKRNAECQKKRHKDEAPPQSS